MPYGCLYKWEDNNHGLEHKCGTCKTVLSSPRAKKTCLGIHEEVCTRYHKTLFFLGQSHHCDAWCRKTDESHVKRHREIIRLIKCIRQHDDTVIGNNSLSIQKKSKRPIFSSNLGTLYNPEKSEESNDPRIPKDDENDEPDPKGRTAVDFFEAPNYRKSVKDQKKSTKQKAEIQVITANDLKQLNVTLHPELAIVSEAKRQDASQGLTNNIIKNNISFNANIRTYSLRTSISIKEMNKAQEFPGINDLPTRPEQWKAIIDRVLEDLGLDQTLPHTTKHRKALDAQLSAAISEDMIVVANERVETMQRMAGYWRYVNRRTYNAMIRTNQIFDWATGAKLPEIDEDIDVSEAGLRKGHDTFPDETEVGFSKKCLSATELERNLGDSSQSEEIVAEDCNNETIDNIPILIAKCAKTPARTTGIRDEDLSDSKNERTAVLTTRSEKLSRPTLTFTAPSSSSRNKFWDRSDIECKEVVEEICSCQVPTRRPFAETNLMRVMKGADCNVLKSEKHYSDDRSDSVLPDIAGLSLFDKQKHFGHDIGTLQATPTPSQEGPIAEDINNRFKGLSIETAVPREDPDLETPKPSHPTPFRRCSLIAMDDGGIANEDFSAPVLKNPASVSKSLKTTPKAKTISIGMTAVTLVDAKNESFKKRRGKTSGSGKIAASTKVDDSEPGKWKTV